jgi:predicted signal transduction protein with EAL and GGDEF domain
VAHRLQSSLRSTDVVARHDHRFTLARLGGDEFTVLVDDITDASDAIRVAERLGQSLQKPFEIDGQQVFTSASIGIVVSGAGYSRPDELLRDGATALHRAKVRANGCEIFDAAMRARAVSRLQAETELRHAIEARAFVVHYQPIVALATGAIAGFEALVRWRHPTRGLVLPSEFIPLAETTGMVLPIGRLALDDACRQMAAWQRRFGRDATGHLSVNVSSRQFADATLLDEVRGVLRETGLTPSSLKLEITESAFIDDVDAAQTTLMRMQAMGVAWSLDDFGTGYSSLSYLHRLAIDTVKVDRSFVQGMGVEENGSKMVHAIITLAHNLGMDVVAEGVETAAQAEELRALGCDYAQGFFYSQPLPAKSVDSLFLRQPWRTAGIPVRR